MSFQEDVKKFIITFLIGLVPILMVDTLVVDRIGEILVIDSKYAFELFRVIYFVLPLVFFLVFSLIISIQKEIRYTYFVLISTVLILAVFSYFSLEIERLKNLGVIVSVVFITHLILSVLTFWIIDRPVKIKEVLKRKKLLFEYAAILFVLVFIGYHLLKDPDKVEHPQLKYRSTSFEKLIIQDFKDHEGKDVNIFEKRDDLIKIDKEADKKDDQAWSDLINHTIYIGILIFILAIGILLNSWMLLRLFNIQRQENAKTSINAEIIKKGENYDVIETNAYDDFELLKVVKGMIMFLTIMITPVFYSINSPKEIKHKPFLNLTINPTGITDQSSRNDQNIPKDTTLNKIQLNQFLDSINKLSQNINSYKNEIQKIQGKLITETDLVKIINQNDSIERVEKYLYAIWNDQKLYQQRFKGTVENGIKLEELSMKNQTELKKEPLDR